MFRKIKIKNKFRGLWLSYYVTFLGSVVLKDTSHIKPEWLVTTVFFSLSFSFWSMSKCQGLHKDVPTAGYQEKPEWPFIDRLVSDLCKCLLLRQSFRAKNYTERKYASHFFSNAYENICADNWVNYLFGTKYSWALLHLWPEDVDPSLSKSFCLTETECNITLLLLQPYMWIQTPKERKQ